MDLRHVAAAQDGTALGIAYPARPKRVPAKCGEPRFSEYGWLFLPMDCANGQACRLHIVFHGRKQYQTYLYFSSGAALRAHLLQRQDDCSLLRSCRNTGRRMLFKSRSTAPQREA
jgi:hypothetical protein